MSVQLFLFDIRRMPNEEDFRLIEWAAHHGIALVLILTKTDKLNQKDKRNNTKKILETFNTENLHHLFYSVHKNQGRRELMALINDALGGE